MKRLAAAMPARSRGAMPAIAVGVGRTDTLDVAQVGSLDDVVEAERRPGTLFGFDGERLDDVVARAVVVVLFSAMAARFGSDFLATGRLNGLLLLVSEGLVVALTVVRRSTAIIDRSLHARLLTALSMLGPPLL